ncbi:Bifunctional inhibitor/lipid-transfer protein/seed storage 2S albumin superfamily protein [Euphorbia peplus]|nr:Bifunctional inhibitor/lipid-transfer protein/seed storage 2S albumin superfamily protein [Euphorbia peplus]
MASSRIQASIAMLLCMNLVLFSMVSAQTCKTDFLQLNARNPLYCSPLLTFTNLEAADCLCLSIKANLFRIFVDPDYTLGRLLTACGKTFPSGYKCDFYQLYSSS